ncbi:MAG: hypothetical protein ACYC6Y_26045, partial [Thermoguttaceae bacterium]
DLGLRAPDAIARESLRILDQALAEATGSEQIDGSKLSERAIRLTVRQSEKLLWLVASQSGSREEPERLGSVIAAHLPYLLAQFPSAIGQDRMPDELVSSLRDRLAPVVPEPRPQRMGRQGLVLAPALLRRMVRTVRHFLLGQEPS